MIKRTIARMLPRPVAGSLKAFKTLSLDYGHYKSMKRWECVDAKNSPIPWYTYPAIEFLRQLDFSGKRVFEYGSGNSTFFWSQRCKSIVSIEDDAAWHSKLKHKLPKNVEYHLTSSREAYIESINEFGREFDVIIIDGSHRFECAVQALSKLRDEGFIILDNSDWHGKTSKMLRDADLIEIDMTGFAPINAYTSTTSFYFTRSVNMKPAHDRQPINGIGSLLQECDA